MDPVRFGIYTTIGCIPWTAALAYAGYAVGSNWQSIVNAFRGPTYVIAGLVVIGLIVATWWYVRRHRADRAAGGRRPDAADRQPDARARR
jgi:membrane protein DedA with SNARE-associated domain